MVWYSSHFVWQTSQNDVIFVTKVCDMCHIWLRKNSELLSIHIIHHARIGGWGFFRFTSSDVHIQTFRRSQAEIETENETENAKKQYNLCRVLAVLTVVKNKIRDIESRRRAFYCFWLFFCLFLLVLSYNLRKKQVRFEFILTSILF